MSESSYDKPQLVRDPDGRYSIIFEGCQTHGPFDVVAAREAIKNNAQMYIQAAIDTCQRHAAGSARDCIKALEELKNGPMPRLRLVTSDSGGEDK